MKAFKGLLPLSGLLLVALIGFVAAGTLHEDLEELANVESENVPFDEDQVGYDKHADIFYYQDQTVDTEYARKNYLATRTILAGQKMESTNRSVQAAVRPFGVAQRTFKNFGTMMDRWDVKDTGVDAQYFALYHGRRSTYVVNKVRAHLLRNLANALDCFLPQLKRIGEEENLSEDNVDVELVLDNVRGTIERVFREVDDAVRKTMVDSDDASASATIAIVTQSHVITASVGEGKVIAYDTEFDTVNLTPFEGERDEKELNNLFGVKKSRGEYIHPHVQFYQRKEYEQDYQFLILETPAVAKQLDDEYASRIVLTEINTHKYKDDEEQEIYSKSTERMVDSLENSLSGYHRFFSHSDYSVLLVGLNTDYQDIH